MSIENIINILKEKGKVLAIKTDTVYGLVCNACDVDAVEKIYRLKKREKKKPLALFIKAIDDIKKYIDEKNITPKAINKLNIYWPGALTAILKKKDNKFDYLLNGEENIGIRIPDDKLLLDILKKVDFPLAQTSCNISGEEECKNADTIREKFGDKIDLIVDGGEVIDNIPSTVISIDNDDIKILRHGAVNISAESFK